MKPPAAGPADTQLRRLEPFGARVSFGEPDGLARALEDRDAVVVDALFGTGVSFPLRDDAVRWIDRLDRAAGTVVSIDLPSGLDGDTGRAPSGCVQAALTLAIGALKPGLLSPGGMRRAGRIEVVPLPYPPRLTAGLRRVGC
jgi:NAD(P)H-hydrate epimerase